MKRKICLLIMSMIFTCSLIAGISIYPVFALEQNQMLASIVAETTKVYPDRIEYHSKEMCDLYQEGESAFFSPLDMEISPNYSIMYTYKIENKSNHNLIFNFDISNAQILNMLVEYSFNNEEFQELDEFVAGDIEVGEIGVLAVKLTIKNAKNNSSLFGNMNLSVF